MGNLNKIFNSLNVVSEGSSYNTIGFKVSKSGSTTNPGITSFIVRDDGSTGVNITLPTSMLTVSGDCRITDLPTGGRLMVTADSIGKLHTQPIPGFPEFGSGCTLTGITVVGPVITFHVVGPGCTATTFTASTTGQVMGPYQIGAGLNAIEPILPIGSNLADAQFSNIQGGTNNQVQAGSIRSNILGGLSNRLINNSRWSSIVGGIDNRIDESAVSSIVGGHHNEINITGFTNGYGLITAGYRNTVLRRYGSVVNGSHNTVIHDFSAIIGAQNTTTDRTYTTFTEGLDVNSNRGNGSPDGQALRYYGAFANPGLNRVLRDSDGLGNAVWSPFGFPDPGSGCTVTGITVVGPVITFHVVGPGCSGTTFTASTVSGTLSPYEYRANQSISTVLPPAGFVTDNYISPGQWWSNSQGGHSNKINTNGNIQSGGQNAIGGGRLNLIGGPNVKVQAGNVALSNIGGGWVNHIKGGDAAYMNIGGGRGNKIYEGSYGHIGGGNENMITASTRSFIGGGDFNHIWGNSDYSSVVGGVANHIWGNYNSIIGGGSLNKIYFQHSIIGGGEAHSIGSPVGGVTTHAGIFAGSGNTIDRSAKYSAIVNGRGNILQHHYSAIIGGADLTTNRTYTTFMEGLDVDTNRGGATNAQAFKYHGTFASPGINKFLMDSDGFGNAVWTSIGIPPISGDCYVVSATTNSATCVTTFYLSGPGCGTVTAKTCNGSYSPYRPTGNQSIVPTVPGGGALTTNIIDFASNNSNVGGGILNWITGGSTNALIAGGRGNRILTASVWSNIGGGVANIIDDGQVSSIVGGHHNEINITGFASGYGLIGAGFQNTVNARYGSIINGSNNTVAAGIFGDFSAIIGAQNKTTDRTYTTFTEGLDVDSARANGAPDGQSFKYHGAFANPGLGRILTDVDGAGTAQWRPTNFPPVDPNCPIVSAYTSNSGCTLHLIDCSGNTVTANTCTTFGSYSPYQIGASGAWQSIEPVLSPFSANALWSSIGGGMANRIWPGGFFGRIGGGQVNWIRGQAMNGYIGGGMFNQISASTSSVVVGGNINYVLNTHHSSIVGGHMNKIGKVGGGDTHANFIGGGGLNFIPDETTYSSIVGGWYNSINNDSDYNFIGGGRFNKLGNTTNVLWTNYSSIVGGEANKIAGDGNADYAAIVNGSGNTVSRNYSAVIGGKGVTANRANTTFMEGLDVDTNLNGTNRPFRYHGSYASNGNPGDVLTSTNVWGDARWLPGGVIWTHGCPIVSATSDNCILTLINCSGGTITADTCNSFGMLSPYEYRGGLDSISTALPDITVANTNYIYTSLAFSNIQGGESNSLNSSGQYNAILGGQSNYIGNHGGATIIGGPPPPPPQGNIYWSVIGGGSENEIRGHDVMGDTIAGGRRNVLTATTSSVISGGWANRISNGQKHTIGGGGYNKIHQDAYGTASNTIGGGTYNIIYDSSASSIAGGDRNTITQWSIGQGSYDSFIGGGETNLVKGGHQSSIVGGEDNTIQNSADWTHMFIGGGKDNTVSDSAKSSIVGGEDNSITVSSSYAAILGGFQNTITPATGSANYSAIVNGSDNTIQHIYSAIIGGGNLITNRQYTTFMEGLDVDTNRGGATNAQAFKYHGTFANNGNPGDVLTSVDALGNAKWLPIGIPPISGDCYVVSATTNSATCVTTFYLSGPGCGTVTASTCSGSYSPYRPTGTDSIVPTVPGGGAWNTNVIDVSSNNSNVGGGTRNRITNNSDTSLIAGGRGNIIRNNATWSNIGGGVANLIDDTRVSSIVGGHHNEVSIGGGQGYGLIGAGFQNTVNAQYGSIINGRDNTVAAGIFGDFSAIIGSQGKTTDRTYTTFTEGLDVDTNRADGSLDGQAFRYYGTWAQVGMRKVLTDIDGAGTAVWMDLPNPPQNPNCPFVSAFTTNSGCTLHLVNCTGGTFTADTCNSFGGVSPYTIGAGIDSIEPVMMIGSANANYSNVQGGFNHNIQSSCQFSSIVGGYTNSILDMSGYSFIGNGKDNTITSATGYSSILGGKDNTLQSKVNYSAILGGNTNYVSNSTNTIIGGGTGNQITGSTNSSISSGEQNIIFNNTNSHISAGKSNKILNGDYNTIGAGWNNLIDGESAHSNISAGIENQITNMAGSVGGIRSFIGAGYGNIISGGSSSTIVAGNYNKITISEGSSGILVGHSNFINGSLNSAIVNGANNYIPGGSTSSAVIGADNRVVDRNHTTFMEGLDVDTQRQSPIATSQAFKYHGTFANPGLNRVLTDIDGLGNAKWVDGGPIRNNPDCPIVSAYTSNSGCTLHLIDCSGNTFTATTCTTFGSYSPYQIGSTGAWNSIEPVLSPGSANANSSSVGGGLTNIIFGTGAPFARIGGGQLNKIYDNSSASYIGAGSLNELRDSATSVIVGGQTNYLRNSLASFIGSGSFNVIGQLGGSQNQVNFIGGGLSNSIMDETVSSSIVGGWLNSINNDSDYNFIGGGVHNRLGQTAGPLWTNYSSILGGKDNEIAGDANADYAAIVNGSGNTVSRNYSAVIGGRGLTANRANTTFMEGLDVDTNLNGTNRPFKYHGTFANNGNPGDVLTAVDALGNAKWLPAGIPQVSGDCYVESATTVGCVTTFHISNTPSCSGLTFTAKTCDGSYSPYRPTGDNSIVPTVPGVSALGENIIDITSSNSNVGGGTHNQITDNSDTSVISGGRNNRIRENSTWSNIGGGVSNIIEDSEVSSILGGHKNVITIPGGGSGYGVVGGGYENTVNARYGSIINGSSNTVAGGAEGDFSAIIGAQNKTTDRTYTTFTEGLDVDSNRGNGSPDGQALRYYGAFANPGLNRILTSVDNLGNAVWRDSVVSYLGDEVVVSAQTIGCILTLTTNSGNTITANTCTTYSGPYKAGQGTDNIIPTSPGGAFGNYTTPASAWSTIQGGILNKISACTTSTIVNGTGNRIVGSANSSILNGLNNVISGSTRGTIINGYLNIVNTGTTDSVIMGASGIKAYTDQTTYTGHQQALGKVRLSSQEYNNTNSLNHSLAKMTLDVVHDTGTIRGMGNNEGGGEIVRFGAEGPGYGTGVLVQLQNGVWTAADANDTTNQGNMLGMALGSNPQNEGVLIRGFIKATAAHDGAWLDGQPLYVHTGTGQISNVVPSTSGAYVRNIGYAAMDETYVYFNPESTYIVVQ